MKFRPTMLVSVTVLVAMMALSPLLSSVLAEYEPNNGKFYAQELTNGSSENGGLNGNDTEDWYYVELNPYEKLTVTLRLIGNSGEVWVYEIFEEDDEGGVEININVNPNNRADEDSYTNDEMTIIKLYLRVAGDGDYNIKVEMSQEAVCCCGSFLLGLVPLLMLLVATLVVVKRIRS